MSVSLKRVIYYFVYILVAWGSFRYFVRLPEVVEELWFKPMIWLVPLFWLNLSRAKRVDLFGGKIPQALIWGLAGGLIYFVILRLLIGNRFAFGIDKVGIAAVTAIVEELTFSGVILGVLVKELKREGWALGLTALGFALIHLPVNLFVFHLGLTSLVGAFWLAFFVCLINGFIRLRANNVLSSMVAHFIYLLLVLV